MEVLRFILFLVTAAAFVKVAENVVFHWGHDKVIDVVPEDDSSEESFVDHEDEKDDLTKIDGITEKMLPMLSEAGFESYSDIELADIVDLKQTIETSFPEVTETELKLWCRQASLAVQGKWDELDRVKEAMESARARKTDAQED
ncbi:MAG: hypothetical protein AAF413_03590 [Patescibacteria group bacterium]